MALTAFESSFPRTVPHAFRSFARHSTPLASKKVKPVGK